MIAILMIVVYLQTTMLVGHLGREWNTEKRDRVCKPPCWKLLEGKDEFTAK